MSGRQGSAGTRPFRQVDVFAASAFAGNPLAVVLEAQGLTDAAMQRIARWTNLSETTFVLPPADPSADYLLRIFTPGGELPFAGHPTLGSAAAWADQSGSSAASLVQECGVGLVAVRRTPAGFAFEAPPLRRSGAVDAADLAAIVAGLGLQGEDVVDAAWVDNGPGWVAVRLRSADVVLGLRPDPALMRHPTGAFAVDETGRADLVVRAFVPGLGVPEDPVTGSLNAGIALWLLGDGGLFAGLPGYSVSQGTAIGRDGRVLVERDGDAVLIAGTCHIRVSGTITL